MATEHFNKLSEAEQERLVILAEECAEVIQVVGKTLRHGYTSTNEGKLEFTNRQQLAIELGHVQHAIRRIAGAHDVEFADVHRAAATKEVQIQQYLHHQPQPEDLLD